MIIPARKRLNIIFMSILVLIFALTLSITYVFLDMSALSSAKSHIVENVDEEFLHHYRKNDLITLGKIVEDELFELLDRNGNVMIEVQSVIEHKPALNRPFLNSAIEGTTSFEVVKGKEHRYIIAYLPIDSEHVLRVTGTLEALDELHEKYFYLMIFIIPLLLFISFLLSRYMVAQSIKPVAQLMEYQESFSSNLTHELNTPLTAVKGNIEVTLKQERPAAEYREALKVALKNINGIIDLLGNLYLLATSDTKGLDVYKEQVDMPDLINDIVEHFEPAIYAKNLELETAVKPGSFCQCDASLIKRTISNLVDNAVKYTPHNGKLRIAAGQDEQAFNLTVSNTCEGVKENEHKNFFSQFYRGDNSRIMKVKGSGLGLFIVNYIVQSHGGKIFSRFDHGVFSVTINIPTQKT